MEKKLPKVYANKIDKEIKNNETVYYDRGDKREIEVPESKKNIIPTELTIQQKINKIFGSSRYVYKADVDITLKDGKISKKVIGRNRNELITMDNELIKIADIIDIKFTEE